MQTPVYIFPLFVSIAADTPPASKNSFEISHTFCFSTALLYNSFQIFSSLYKYSICIAYTPFSLIDFSYPFKLFIDFIPSS